jgi:long-chain acyl-CoA synthetase
MNIPTVDQTESQIVIVEDDKKVNLILDKSTRHLKKIVAIKELRPSTLQRAKNQGINIWMFDEVERIGALKNHVEEPPHPDGEP